MGNDQQKGKKHHEAGYYGDIFFKLDTNVCFPEDTLSGTVYLDLKHNYPGDKLCFQIKGEEYTKWIDKEPRHRNKPDGTQETYYVNVKREQEVKIINNELTIYDWKRGKVIPPGQYSFPVSWRMPGGLPGSFFLARGDVVAEIEYKIEAYLKPEDPKVPKLKYKRNLIIRENVQKSIKTKEMSVTRPLSSCCMSKGSLSLRTAFEKDAYAPGEEARVLAEVDNSQGQLIVTNVMFSLNQSIKLQAGPHQKNINFPIKSLDLGGANAGEKCTGNKRKEGSIQLPPGLDGSSRDYRGSDDAMPNFSPDPTSFLTPSTHGRLVKSDFSLSINCAVDGCMCCDVPPSTSLPVQIYSAAGIPEPDPMPPVGWNPQPMPPATLTITIVQRADGGQDIHIDTGSNPNPGMANNQMPQQQPMKNQQPMMNTQQQPMMNTQQQPVYPQQPMMNTQQQPVYPQQPMMNTQGQPMMNTQGQPIMNTQGQPIMNTQGQPVYPQQPMMNTQQQPSYQQPMMNTQQQPSYQQPMMNTQQQPIMNIQPQQTAINQKPNQFNAQPNFNMSHQMNNSQTPMLYPDDNDDEEYEEYEEDDGRGGKQKRRVKKGKGKGRNDDNDRRRDDDDNRRGDNSRRRDDNDNDRRRDDNDRRRDDNDNDNDRKGGNKGRNDDDDNDRKGGNKGRKDDDDNDRKGGNKGRKDDDDNDRKGGNKGRNDDDDNDRKGGNKGKNDDDDDDRKGGKKGKKGNN